MLVVLGVVPLLLGSISAGLQPTAFAIFFAMLWGAIFKTRVIPIQGHWKLFLGTFFFTGTIGLGLLIAVSTVLHFSLGLFWSTFGESLAPHVIWRQLVYMVVMVGIPEEFSKAIPVCMLIWWSPKKRDHRLIILTGVFSGLGFGAFENISYGQAAGAHFATAGDAGAWVTLRAMSLVFCHGTWSGTCAYFMTIGLRQKFFSWYFLLGVLTAGTIHGVYNWLTEVQLTMAAAVVACAWALFYANLLNMGPTEPSKESKHVIAT